MSYLILPKKLDDAIKSIHLSKIQTNHCYEFIYQLYFLHHYNDDDVKINSFKDILSTTIRKKIAYEYPKFLDPLIKSDIIKRSYYYNTKGRKYFIGKCPLENKAFGYKINENLFDFSEIVFVEWNKKVHKPKNIQIKAVIKDLQKLEIDVEGMMQAIINYNIDEFMEINEEITGEMVEIKDLSNNQYIHYNLKTSNALERAKKWNLDLINYKEFCYYDNAERFKRVQLNNFKASQVYTVTKLLNNDYYASINSTNFRLDTNLTNLKSSFIKDGYVKLNGENLIDIDMKNSQPTLLAYLLSDIEGVIAKFHKFTGKYKFPAININAPDTIDFIQKAGSGLIYDYICSVTGWERSFAKIIFLRTMFSRPGWNSGYKKKLKELFPGVISWIDNFKAINGHKELAILLQKIESNIFIQNIYPAIRKEYLVFTKHDSILCQKSQKPEIKKKMEELINSYGFKYRLE